MLPIFAGVLSNRYVIGFIFIFTLLTGGYIYYLRTNAKIERLTNDNKQLELENDSLKMAKEKLEKDHQAIVQSNKELSEEISKTKKQVDSVKETLYRENNKKKSLEELAQKKTSLIEKLVNKGTKEVLRCFETISKGGNC